MAEGGRKSDSHVLDNGAKIAVIGGGPTGSFFSIFALKMAKMIDMDLEITIFEQKDFSQKGPGGCNRCGGVISELLVQTLAVEGINLPDSVIRKGINSYNLHTDQGDVYIATPSLDKSIATVHRGGGPRGVTETEKESFDNFLLGQAVKEGAAHSPAKIDGVERKNGRPRLFSKGQEMGEFDLVVGAFGLTSPTAKLFEEVGFGYRRPGMITAAMGEVALEREIISEYFGNSIHLFLLPMKDIKFAAIIPKDNYVTVCILGKNVTGKVVDDFIAHPKVRAVLPDSVPVKLSCRCFPRMNVGAPKKPFSDRMVMCGDAGSTRLFKDGIGAAYIMGKAAAKTVVFEGVGSDHFQKYYYPVYRDIVIDNLYGRFLFTVTDLYRKNSVFCRGMLSVVKSEQKRADSTKVLSSILWDMFTGNERYKSVFQRTLDVKMNMEQVKNMMKILAGRGHG